MFLFWSSYFNAGPAAGPTPGAAPSRPAAPAARPPHREVFHG